MGPDFITGALLFLNPIFYRSAIKPDRLVKNCFPGWFVFGEQQDSGEYLRFLLDNLHEEVSRRSDAADVTLPGMIALILKLCPLSFPH